MADDVPIAVSETLCVLDSIKPDTTEGVEADAEVEEPMQAGMVLEQVKRIRNQIQSTVIG